MLNNRIKPVVDNNVCDIGVEVYDNSQVQRCCIGKNVRIGNECRIINSIIYEDVTVEDKCRIENSIIMNGAIIRSGTILEECIVRCKSIVEPSSSEDRTYTKEHYL